LAESHETSETAVRGGTHLSAQRGVVVGTRTFVPWCVSHFVRFAPAGTNFSPGDIIKHRRTRNKMESLDELLEEELKDIYSAEKQLLKAMPRMAKKASSPELKRALEEHLRVTEGQVQRLEQVFQSLGQPAKAKTCKAMQGLLEEAKEIMGEDASPSVLDAGIIAAAQKVEHYEIASYGTVRTWARLCGQEEAAGLLQQTLDEEGEADERLTQLAESIVNPQAEEGGDAQMSGGGGSRGGSSKSSSKKSGGSKKSSGSSKKSSAKSSRR
jgi:ferritin-like metal-binding protein YciE